MKLFSSCWLKILGSFITFCDLEFGNRVSSLENMAKMHVFGLIIFKSHQNRYGVFPPKQISQQALLIPCTQIILLRLGKYGDEDSRVQV